MFESNCLDRASASENTRLGSTKALLFGHSVSFTPQHPSRRKGCHTLALRVLKAETLLAETVSKTSLSFGRSLACRRLNQER